MGRHPQLSLLPQTGETWAMPNCSQATCEGNNVISLGPRPCPQVPEPTCANGYPAVKVTDEDGCCLHYQCQCEQGARRAAGQGLRFHTRKGFPAVGGGWVGRAAQTPLRPPPASPGPDHVGGGGAMTWRLTAQASQSPLVPFGRGQVAREPLAPLRPRWPRRCVQRLGRPPLHHL